MIDVSHSLALIAVMAGVTAVLRLAPFVLFSKTTPKPIMYLGNVLPYAIIAMLVVYCFREVDFTSGSHGAPELIAAALTAALHKWRHNTLLSILAGTICYMLLIQLVFV